MQNGSRASFRVARGNSGLLSSRSEIPPNFGLRGDLVVFLELQQEARDSSRVEQGSGGNSRVSKRESSLLSSCLGELGIALKLLQGNCASLQVWGNLVVFLDVWLESQGSCQVGTGISLILLSCLREVKPPF